MIISFKQKTGIKFNILANQLPVNYDACAHKRSSVVYNNTEKCAVLKTFLYYTYLQNLLETVPRSSFICVALYNTLK